ncbi:hypothetical protein RISK_003951 [Rhodopirellula islandica]|uniref:Uncharacterized protein n=1 Tax=Rhodopirellula islandica TaxID=595434 RepID=A0A0J1BBG8_RHOIS|nr:hypothetical protein RISK_003951 [Rhodopirellula islandica]
MIKATRGLPSPSASLCEVELEELHPDTNRTRSAARQPTRFAILNMVQVVVGLKERG